MTNQFFYGYVTGALLMDWINVIAIGLIPVLFTTSVILLLTLMVLIIDYNQEQVIGGSS